MCGSDTFFFHDEAECLNPLHLFTLPVSLMAIAVTSILDSPTLPYFGSVTMTVGFPRTQRFWPRF